MDRTALDHDLLQHRAIGQDVAQELTDWRGSGFAAISELRSVRGYRLVGGDVDRFRFPHDPRHDDVALALASHPRLAVSMR